MAVLPLLLETLLGQLARNLILLLVLVAALLLVVLAVQVPVRVRGQVRAWVVLSVSVVVLLLLVLDRPPAAGMQPLITARHAQRWTTRRFRCCTGTPWASGSGEPR